MFVLTTEFSGVRHRGIAGSLVWIGYEITVMILSGVAYFIRDWKELTIVTSVPGIVYVAGWLQVTIDIFLKFRNVSVSIVVNDYIN